MNVSADVDELRARRRQLQDLDDAVSYVRRVAQGRADLTRAELGRRQAGAVAGTSPEAAELQDELRHVLAGRLLADGGRPPRPIDDFSDHPRALDLDRLCAEHGFGRLPELDATALEELVMALDGFEAAVSAERQTVFAELDALTDELVTAYRGGLADGTDLSR